MIEKILKMFDVDPDGKEHPAKRVGGPRLIDPATWVGVAPSPGPPGHPVDLRFMVVKRMPVAGHISAASAAADQYICTDWTMKEFFEGTGGNLPTDNNLIWPYIYSVYPRFTIFRYERSNAQHSMRPVVQTSTGGGVPVTRASGGYIGRDTIGVATWYRNSAFVSPIEPGTASRIVFQLQNNPTTNNARTKLNVINGYEIAIPSNIYELL